MNRINSAFFIITLQGKITFFFILENVMGNGGEVKIKNNNKISYLLNYRRQFLIFVKYDIKIRKWFECTIKFKNARSKIYQKNDRLDIYFHRFYILEIE